MCGTMSRCLLQVLNLLELGVGGAVAIYGAVVAHTCGTGSAWVPLVAFGGAMVLSCASSFIGARYVKLSALLLLSAALAFATGAAAAVLGVTAVVPPCPGKTGCNFVVEFVRARPGCYPADAVSWLSAGSHHMLVAFGLFGAAAVSLLRIILTVTVRRVISDAQAPLLAASSSVNAERQQMARKRGLMNNLGL